jgi:hypothetical protein
VVLDQPPLRAERHPGADERAVPDRAAGEREQREPGRAQAGRAGRDRHQAANAGHQPADQHRPPAVALEPADGAPDVVLVDQRQPCEQHGRALLAQGGAEP